ncbi:MAG: decaprenyl-phosphate phosphoribosyltransferase [Acidimicrobiia bacterium]
MTTPAAPSGIFRAVLRTARPKQWAKNVLVFAAPAAAGVIRDGHVLKQASITFLVFCLTASGLYFLNDAADVHADRAHPTKRLRPMAAGVMSIGTGVAIGLVLMVSGLALSVAVNWDLTGVIAIYIAQTIAYSVWLKHVPVLDLATVATGFVLRAVAGGVATSLPLSEWFLIVTGAGSLFMVTGKRFAELKEHGIEMSTRHVLSQYSLEYLRGVMFLAAAVATSGYAQFAFSKGAVNSAAHTWYQLSVVPFVLALMRYALVVEHGDGGAPEDVVLGDRVLQVLGLIWAVVFAVAVSRG